MLLKVTLLTTALAGLGAASSWGIKFYANGDCTGNYASYHNDYWGSCNAAGADGDNCRWNTDAGQSGCTGPMVPRPAAFKVSGHSDCKLIVGDNCTAGNTYGESFANQCIPLTYSNDNPLSFECQVT